MSNEQVKTILEATIKYVDVHLELDQDQMREELSSFLKQAGIKPRDGFRPLFYAMYGSNVGLPVFDVMRYLGNLETVKRLQAFHQIVEASLRPDVSLV